MPAARARIWLGAPALIGVAGLGVTAPASASPHTATVTTAYVANLGSDSITPINTATGKAGPAIRIPGRPAQLTATPDGSTLYVGTDDGVVPVSTATGKAGALIPTGGPAALAVTPDGKTLLAVIAGGASAVIPISTATNIPGTPIPTGDFSNRIVVTPDGKQAYTANSGDGTVTPINLTADTAGAPIITGDPSGDDPTSLAVTPGGKTVYAAGDLGGRYGAVPISVAANTAGSPIALPGAQLNQAQVSQDGKTLWVLGANGFLDRVSVATGKVLPAIRIRGELGTLTVTPKTVYVGQGLGWGRLVPVNAVTGIRGPDIPGARAITAAALAPGGKTVWALGGDSRTALPVSVAANAPGKAVPVGYQPDAVVVVCHRI